MRSSCVSKSLAQFLDRHGAILCTAVAFTIPLKLVWTYLLLFPLLGCWLLAGTPGIKESYGKSRSVCIPLSFLLVFFLFSGLVGISFLDSIQPIFSLLMLAITVLLFGTYSRFLNVVVALVGGQTLAAAHSVLDSAFPGYIPSIFLGKVTESGQISFTICLAVGLAFAFSRSRSLSKVRLSSCAQSSLANSRVILVCLVASSISITLLFLLGFSDSYGFSLELKISILVSLIVLLLAQNLWGKRYQWGPFILTTAIPLISVALLVNLKRGPWLGLVVSAITTMIILAPRLVPLGLAAVAALVIFVTPIRDRVGESYSHFTIVGGRQVIWEVGAELAVRYPLGIGFQNSPSLRDYSSEIPPELRHFHNNLLNVLVESGPLGLGTFLWMVVASIYEAFPKRKERGRSTQATLAMSLCMGIISWQTAGLVEYNFGDTEVLLVFVVLIGSFLPNRETKESLSTNEDTSISDSSRISTEFVQPAQSMP